MVKMKPPAYLGVPSAVSVEGQEFKTEKGLVTVPDALAKTLTSQGWAQVGGPVEEKKSPPSDPK
ncbi:MAG: hypothetical protein KGL39_26695 [Patescibacteria group bacterium]|nr:hypothetical protein [Patescibacteria group bacterium]